jgi:hypothetical protein
MLQHGQSHQRFDTGHEGAAFIQSIFIVERDFHDIT